MIEAPISTIFECVGGGTRRYWSGAGAGAGRAAAGLQARQQALRHVPLGGDRGHAAHGLRFTQVPDHSSSTRGTYTPYITLPTDSFASISSNNTSLI